MYAIRNKINKKWLYGTDFTEWPRKQRIAENSAKTFETLEDARYEFKTRECNSDEYEIVKVRLEIVGDEMINGFDIGNDLASAYEEGYERGYQEALENLMRKIVNNEDLPTRTNPHYLDGRIDKQNLILKMIEDKLERFQDKEGE